MCCPDAAGGVKQNRRFSESRRGSVRIASRSQALSIEKARRELGYAPRPIGGALEEAVQSILSKSQQSTNRDIMAVRTYSGLPDKS